MTPGTGPHQSGPSQDGTLEKRYDTQLATTRAYAAKPDEQTLLMEHGV
jgi:hypothetical protein